MTGRALIIVATCLAWPACMDVEPEAGQTASMRDQPDQEGWNSTVIISTGGITDARITYGHMKRWNHRQLTTFGDSVHVDFFENGRHTATMTADSGEIRGDNSNLTAFGRVNIQSDSGLSMRTERIYWDNQKQTVFADGFVTLTTEEDTLYGYAFESNKDLTNWRMRNAYGQTGRDIDIRTGTVRKSRVTRTQDVELEMEMEEILKDKP